MKKKGGRLFSMAKQQLLTVEGEVIEALPNVMFRVMLDDTGVVILCQACGNMRRNYIKVIVGDRVRVEMSPYDLTRGRIISRL